MQYEKVKIKADLITKLVDLNTKFITTSFVIFLGTFFTLLNESIKFEGTTFFILGCIGILMVIAYIKYAIEMSKDKKQLLKLIQNITKPWKGTSNPAKFYSIKQLSSSGKKKKSANLGLGHLSIALWHYI